MLADFARLGAKYESTRMERNDDGQGPVSGVSFGTYAYNLEEYLKDASSDEEEQVDFQIESHTLPVFGPYESNEELANIRSKLLQINRDLTESEKPQLEEQISKADNWYNKGLDAMAIGQRLSAIQCFKQALIKNQLHYVAMYNLAVLYFRAHKLSSARKWFLKVCEIEPNLGNAYWGVCLAYFKLGAYSKAEKVIEQGIKTLMFTISTLNEPSS